MAGGPTQLASHIQTLQIVYQPKPPKSSPRTNPPSAVSDPVLRNPCFGMAKFQCTGPATKDTRWRSGYGGHFGVNPPLLGRPSNAVVSGGGERSARGDTDWNDTRRLAWPLRSGTGRHITYSNVPECVDSRQV